MTDLALVAAWLVVNLVAAAVLAVKFRGRPFSPRASGARLVVLMLSIVWCGLFLACAFSGATLSWGLALGLLVAMAPIPVWVGLRRSRYPTWGPTPRGYAAALSADTLARWTWAVAHAVERADRTIAEQGLPADPLPIASWAAVHHDTTWAWLTFGLVPMLLFAIPALLSRPRTPEFSAHDRAQSWWPRTPGYYAYALGSDRWFWDGSRWLDRPELARQRPRGIAQRRVVAQMWTSALFWSWFAVAEASYFQEDGHPTGSAGWAVLVLALVVAVVSAVGAVLAWRSLDRPLAADSDFPPTSRPKVLAAPEWLVNPDDPSSWRFWDGRGWTKHTVPVSLVRDDRVPVSEQQQ